MSAKWMFWMPFNDFYIKCIQFGGNAFNEYYIFCPSTLLDVRSYKFSTWKSLRLHGCTWSNWATRQLMDKKKKRKKQPNKEEKKYWEGIIEKKKKKK